MFPNMPLYLEHLTEPALADEVEEEVAGVECWVALEPRGVLCQDALQFPNVQVPLSLQLL